MRTVSIVGFSNSGKTTVASALIAEAVRQGMRVAAVKVGHPSRSGGERLRDTDRLSGAGADPVAFRTPQGWSMEVDDAGQDHDASLELPPWLLPALEGVDLLVVEGRHVRGAYLVQTVGADGQQKFTRCDTLITDAREEPLPRELLQILELETAWQTNREVVMGHRNGEERSPERRVVLNVGGKPVEMNGFVQDLFQEVVVGLVRSLGSQDVHARIELSIGAAGEKSS